LSGKLTGDGRLEMPESGDTDTLTKHKQVDAVLTVMGNTAAAT